MNIKKCRVCGLIAPADAFPKGRCVCKTCYRGQKTDYMARWRKTHPRKPSNPEQAKEYRQKLKARRGNSYTSDASAEKRRAYQRNYYSEHKNDESYKMKRREWQKKRYQLTKHD